MLGETARVYTKPLPNFRDALTPTQAEEMGRFLIALSKGADLCRQTGIKPDISAAIWSWGHVPQTAEEHAISSGFREREKEHDRIMKIITEDAMKLWKAGLTDSEIAEHFNCSKIAIQSWRKRNYLLCNKKIVKTLVNQALLTKLWENGLKDSEIAKEMKCSTITVWNFRKENDMGSNVGLFDWGRAKESRGKVEGK